MGNKSSSSVDRPTRRKLTPEQEAEVVRLFDQGFRLELLAVRFDVHFNTVRNVLKRVNAKTLTHEKGPSS